MSEYNLPDVVQAGNQEVMDYVGQSEDFPTALLPSLRVNYNDVDNDGNELPRGKWTINHDGKQVFASECYFRIMMIRKQYSHFDQDLGKPVATSIYFKSQSDEIPDDQGGFKAGKVSKDRLKDLSESEQVKQKSIKLAQVLFGYATLSGVDTDGNEVDFEEVPCQFFARGTNFMPIAEFVQDLTRKGILAPNVLVKFGLKAVRQEGRNTYWTVVPEVADTIELTKEDNDKLRFFSEIINEENKEIIRKHEDNKKEMAPPFDIEASATDVPFDDEYRA